MNPTVPVLPRGAGVRYFKRVPHPPSERGFDAGQLPPWLPGVTRYGARVWMWW